MSDMHGQIPRNVPDGDILVIAGDICPLYIDRDIQTSADWIDDVFVPWVRSMPHKYRLFIAGNHDFAIQDRLKYFQDYIDPEDIKFLHDSGVNIEGCKIYGLPWVPKLKNWAFHADNVTLGQRYRSIPDDTDVIVSHGPPYHIGMADAVPFYNSYAKQQSIDWAGTPYANQAIDRIGPKHFICGHIHEGAGHYRHNGPKGLSNIWNVSVLDEYYEYCRDPTVIEID